MGVDMRKAGLAFIITASLCMTACGSTIPEMTEEQNAQVVEYAAGLLLKYDKNHHSRLVEETEIETETENIEEQPQAENEQPETSEEVKEETPVVDVSTEPVEAVYSSIEEFYGIEGITINYTGYELKDIYPDGDAEEMYFAMSATKGCKLVVLQFEVANTSGQDRNVDMLAVGSKFKISVNGANPRYALTTMLTNDLSSYVGTIAAGTSENLILVVELPEEEAQSIQTLSLVIKNVSEDATISLN